jgi:hypothetical protein
VTIIRRDKLDDFQKKRKKNAIRARADRGGWWRAFHLKYKIAVSTRQKTRLEAQFLDHLAVGHRSLNGGRWEGEDGRKDGSGGRKVSRQFEARALGWPQCQQAKGLAVTRWRRVKCDGPRVPSQCEEGTPLRSKGNYEMIH